MDYKQLTKDLQNKLHNEILPTRTLLFTVESLNEQMLTLKAPLDLNINDKGTAFGGSIASLATITGWSLCWVLSKIHSLDLDIVIHKSSMEYKRPVTEDFCATVHFPEKQEIDEVFTKLESKGKASLDLTVEIVENGKVCFEYFGRYVFINK